MKTVVTGFKITDGKYHVTFIHGDNYRNATGGAYVSIEEAKGKSDAQICLIALAKVIDSLRDGVAKISSVVGTEMDTTGL